MAASLHGRHKLAWLYGLSAGSLALDQLTKTLVRASMAIGETHAVVPGFFNLRHVINLGGAFSLLHGQVWLLAAVSLAVVIGIVAYERRRGAMPRWQTVGLGILLGGTLGNLIDRVARGQVTDFLDVYVGAYHWPTFNVADICINVGVGLLVIGTMLAPTTQEDPSR